ncbi:hypothetical protein QBC36DRAFT_360713 [Triangularia setosa]|uniref:Uncharacterized protein n=1 Tax=Triangularia setosa TaxID=2587417 RepID=A0AAN6W2L3_9PEZI|nr:hypothetical protein QBC36DRAFT_360713 [Podospora setosa]
MPDVNGNNPQSPSVRCVSITDGSKPHPFKPVWRIWGLGLMSISFSYLIFIAIVIVLASHSQKQLPSWPLKISLNSALAFLTTLAKAAFMWPVSNAISQAQWSWFLQDRPLYDFHLIDQASRGSWGALALLWRVRHRHFVTLAALLSIICVLTSPLTQLAIDYPSRYVPSPGADGAQVSSIGVLKSFVHENLVQAINKALNELPWPMKDYEYELVSPTGAVCSTGNCTFEELHSLGVCVEFADISSNLKIQRGDNLSLDASANDYYKYWIIDESNITIWNASIPQAYPHGRSLDLVHQGKLAVFMDVLTGNCSIAFLANENLMQTKVASLVLIRTVPVLETQGESDRKQIAEQSNYAEILSSIQEVRYEAIEILFHLCVQSYHIRVDRGIQNTTLVSSTTRPTESSSSFFMDFTCVDMAEDQVICDQLQESRFDRYNDTLYLEGPTNPSAVPELRGYGATYEAIETIAREMKALLMTFGQEHPLQVEERPEDIYLDLLFDTISRPLWTSIFLDPQNLLDPQRATDRIKTIFMNFAIGLSSGLRENRLRYQVSDEIGNITGIAWMEESYVNITWGWLTFLAVELVIATAFLFITILVQIRMRAKLATGGRNNISVVEDYKDSYLAPLFALSQEARFAAGGRLQPMDVMKETAKRVHVRLEGTEVVPSQMREAL